MHCPKCGQIQTSDETRFCSKCGFLLSGVAEVVSNEGLIPRPQQTGITGNSGSRRRRGIMQGLFIFLLSFLIVPIISIISIALEIEPYAVFISALLLSVGGLLRIAYALMFESTAPDAKTTDLEFAVANRLAGEKENRTALPASRSVPAAAYTSPAGSWRDTNDLQHEPASVTDTTTKLLQKEEQDQ